MKRGRLSQQDRTKMLEMSSEGKTVAQIAKKLGRSEEFITKSLPQPEVPVQGPTMPKAGDVLLSPNRKKGVVVMSQAASELAEAQKMVVKNGETSLESNPNAAPSGKVSPRFTDCITKAQKS